jgi:hypothetical protein
VTSCIVNRPPLKAIGREQDALLSAGRSEAVREHLNVLALDRSHAVLAFDEHEEINFKLGESQTDVDSILTIRCGN